MFNENSLRQAAAIVLVFILLIFLYFLIRPIFLSILLGLVLAYSFNPVNKIIRSKIKNPTLSSTITCTIVSLIIFAVIWFLIPILIRQIIDSYLAIQNIDVFGNFEKLFPFLFASEQSASLFSGAYHTLISATTNNMVSKFTDLIVDIPTLLFKLLVVLIVFFFGLRDGDKILNILRDSLPFSKSITNRFIEKSRQVTFSVIFGRVIVGILIGGLIGIGFYFTGIKGALFLTVLAIISSIFPIIGPWIVWIPVVVGMFLANKFVAGLFLLLYCGILVTVIEHILHTVYVSHTSKIPTSLTLIGMMGGLIVFGVFGIILGPLIMAYLSVLFEIYSENKVVLIK